MTALHFDDADVRRLLSLEALLPAMRRALTDLSAGRVVQPLRTVMEIPAEQGFFFLKPALTADALATKLITLIPGNPARGLPTLLATIVLMDPATGRTLATMDGTWITELRTAAVSAVAAVPSDALCERLYVPHAIPRALQSAGHFDDDDDDDDDRK
jgi:ornithine cyclodeaminase/alanine dehydrogenase-like protein (mu-crystallin family)